MNKKKLSISRQQVYKLGNKRTALEQIAMSRLPMVAASLIKRRFRSVGTIAYYLSIPTPHNSWHQYVRKDELEYYSKRTDAWREFVHAMAEWVKVNHAIEYHLRALGKQRCEKLVVRRRSTNRMFR